MSFQCQRCGKCCREFKNFVMSKAELKKIAKYLGIQWKALKKTLKVKLRANKYYIKQPCPFLNEDNVCTIYTVRPLNCIRFPIEAMMQDPKLLKLWYQCPALMEYLPRIYKEHIMETEQ